MRDDQRIKPLDAGGAQIRNDDALPGVRFGTVERPRVVEQRVLRGAHQHGQPLPDIEHLDPGRTVCRARRRPEERGQ